MKILLLLSYSIHKQEEVEKILEYNKESQLDSLVKIDEMEEVP